MIAIGIRLAVVEPRISAALLFAGSFVPRTMFADARQVTIPLLVLLQRLSALTKFRVLAMIL